MPGTPLSSHDRDEIHHALVEARDVSWAEIGRRVERHPTTIMREVTANGGRHSYRPATGQRRAVRCRRRPRARRLGEPGELRNRIRNELALGRSPVAIVLDLRAEDVAGRPCVETIYLGASDFGVESWVEE